MYGFLGSGGMMKKMVRKNVFINKTLDLFEGLNHTLGK